jgi:two-component system chemotaxis sensor kinase CheA
VLPPGRRPSEALADLGACRLQQLTAELRDVLLEASTQSLGELWRRLPHLVGEVAATCAKQVRLETAGEANRIDRHRTEPLHEALVHALRNAVDHGIETPEWRIACAKPPEGRITLGANLEGDDLIIEIHDDGEGIDLNHLKRRALQLGLITAPYAAGMSSQELVDLVFTPGFSTAEPAMEVSGRGIGLDVVKHSIAKIGGSVELSSRHGQGTTVRIRLPRSGPVQSLGESTSELVAGS